MKKIAIIFLLFFYSLSSIGATIELHYCMNELVAFSFWPADHGSKCIRCGMKEKKSGCCKNEQKKIKVSGDQKKSNTTYITPIVSPALLTSFIINVHAPLLSVFNPIQIAPQHIRKKRLYLLNCVFLV